MQTIFGDPIQFPRRKVSAWVGALASDFLGEFDSPRKAVEAAKRGNYRVVHVTYRNNACDTIAVEG